MRITIKQRRHEADRIALIEIVTPRLPTATMAAAESLFGTLIPAGAFGFEIAATRRQRRFLARAESPAPRHLTERLGAVYPHSELRDLDRHRDPERDPAWPRVGEQVATCLFVLRGPPYLPLRTFRDADPASGGGSETDPLLSVLAALGEVPEGWRTVSQLVLRPAPDDWCRPYLRLALEDPLARERTAGQSGTSLDSVHLLTALLVLGMLGLLGYTWSSEGAWPQLAGLLASVLVGGPGAIWLRRRLSQKPVYDRRLIGEKISRPAYRAQLRLAVFAPAEVPRREVEARLDQMAAAYRQFSLPHGNGLIPRRAELRGHDLARLVPLGGLGSVPLLTTRELAGFRSQTA